MSIGLVGRRSNNNIIGTAGVKRCDTFILNPIGSSILGKCFTDRVRVKQTEQGGVLTRKDRWAKKLGQKEVA